MNRLFYKNIFSVIIQSSHYTTRFRYSWHKSHVSNVTTNNYNYIKKTKQIQIMPNDPMIIKWHLNFGYTFTFSFNHSGRIAWCACHFGHWYGRYDIVLIRIYGALWPIIFFTSTYKILIVKSMSLSTKLLAELYTRLLLLLCGQISSTVAIWILIKRDWWLRFAINDKT